MVDVSDQPLGSPAWTGNVRMGDPVPYDPDPRFVTLLYPYNPNDPPNPTTYARWPDVAVGWQASEIVDAKCLFVVNVPLETLPGRTAAVLHAERAGPLDWLLIPGLF